MAEDKKLNRKDFLRMCGRGAGGLVLGAATLGLTAKSVAKGSARGTLWQIDPEKCTQCGQCATHCVLDQSAVRCFHEYIMCGYCDLCTGFFIASTTVTTEAAENQQCPTGAIRRKFIEDPYFNYDIDVPRCIGCGICVKGCVQYGNGSLYLQVSHDICKNCNECAIAVHCPSKAFVRVPSDKPYISRFKDKA
jgi:electron transport complex protein RnfB